MFDPYSPSRPAIPPPRRRTSLWIAAILLLLPPAIIALSFPFPRIDGVVMAITSFTAGPLFGLIGGLLIARHLGRGTLSRVALTFGLVMVCSTAELFVGVAGFAIHDALLGR